MCGIAGILAMQGIEDRSQGAEVASMLRTLAHRGPDEVLVRQIGPATIGCCRLRIVDPRNGSQPMVSRCNGTAIAYNGEIYNYRELRSCLRQPHQIVGQSDTEVLLHLFEEDGVECLTQLNGMFALCIVEGATAYLVRDRFGVKPLYYIEDKVRHRLLFASEAKALLRGAPQLCVEPTYGCFETNVGSETLFRGVLELPSGHFLHYNSLSGAYAVRRYYVINHFPESVTNEKQAIERMRSLTEDAVAIRTKVDIPFGCYVSGGLDSAVVACLSKPNLLVSSIVRDRSYLDEERYVLRLREAIGSPFLSIEPQLAEFPRYFVEMVYALDFPVTTLAAFVQFLLSRAVALSGLRLMVSGLGADEYLNGYVRHVAMLPCCTSVVAHG